MFHSFRRIKVNLICQNHPSTELSTERDDGHQLEYVFYLSSPAACPSKQSSSHHEGYKSIIGPIGIGIIFLYGSLVLMASMLFLISLVLYSFFMQCTILLHPVFYYWWIDYEIQDASKRNRHNTTKEILVWSAPLNKSVYLL